MNDGKQVLVTGGTGFVAGWTIVELLTRGHRVRTTIRSPRSEARVREAVSGEVALADRLSFAIADLTSDQGWDAAMAGCEIVLHVASPLAGDTARDPHALTAPAREGTVRVLRAAQRAGVARTVMTSAAAAARPRLDAGRVSDETVWADPQDPQFDAYRVSKILAERAAWDEVTRAGSPRLLTTILPGAVFGPVLSKDNLGSVRIIQRLLEGKPPALPRLGFAVVDVRDLAALHVSAMTHPDAAGERLLATGEFLWMTEIARLLKTTGALGARVPTRQLPDWIFRLMAFTSPELRSLAPMLGHLQRIDNGKARRVLGFAARPAQHTLTDTARRLHELKLV